MGAERGVCIVLFLLRVFVSLRASFFLHGIRAQFVVSPSHGIRFIQKAVVEEIVCYGGRFSGGNRGLFSRGLFGLPRIWEWRVCL